MPAETAAERGESPGEAAGLRGPRGDAEGGSEANGARPESKRSGAGRACGVAKGDQREAAGKACRLPELPRKPKGSEAREARQGVALVLGQGSRRLAEPVGRPTQSVRAPGGTKKLTKACMTT